VTAEGLGRALFGNEQKAAFAESHAAPLWRDLAAQAGPGSTALEDGFLEFQDFLIALHRLNSPPAAEKGWLDDDSGRVDEK